MSLREGSKWKTKGEKVAININKYKYNKTKSRTVKEKCKEREKVIVIRLSEGNSKTTDRFEAKDGLSKRKRE